MQGIEQALSELSQQSLIRLQRGWNSASLTDIQPQPPDGPQMSPPGGGTAQPQQEGGQEGELQPNLEQFKCQQSVLLQGQAGLHDKAQRVQSADAVQDPGVYYMPCMF